MVYECGCQQLHHDDAGRTCCSVDFTKAVSHCVDNQHIERTSQEGNYHLTLLSRPGFHARRPDEDNGLPGSQLLAGAPQR